MGSTQGLGTETTKVRACSPSLPSEEENPGGLAASVGKVVLSQLIALTPGQMPTPPWPPLLGDRHL